MSRAEPMGLFAEVLPPVAKKAVLPRMHLQGVDGDPEPAPKKRKKAPLIAPDIYDDHDYAD